MDTANVDLFLSTRRLRAEIPLRGFSRLSDVLNNTPGDFLAGTLRGISDVRFSVKPLADGSVERDLVVRIQDVLMVQPLDPPTVSPGSTAERRDRILQRMVLELGDWRLEGSLHLVDCVRWVDFATANNERFLAMTQATVAMPGAEASFESSLVLVNGARVSALYEC
ncbi:MAG: hypothetical protein JO020_17040 [Chloroflexi bacterium]|nr:hypothetical protein [Chloroflexota bacterium]MBV9895872.1 hypothetical protein [Chloroflexota bacterium]